MVIIQNTGKQGKLLIHRAGVAGNYNLQTTNYKLKVIVAVF